MSKTISDKEYTRLKEIERRWDNIQPRYVYIINDTGHYVNKAIFEKLTFQQAELKRLEDAAILAPQAPGAE